MPVNKNAVQRFLNRPLESYNWIKDMSDAELDKELAQSGITFHTTPYKHQKACTLIGAHLSCFLFLLQQGLGKSKIALDIISRHMQAENVHKTLVLVPNLVSIQNWVDEVETHAPHLKACGMYGSRHERWEMLRSDKADIYIINYDGLTALVSELMAPKRGKGKRRKQTVQPALLQKVAEMFQCMIMDESHSVKNNTSLRFKVCNILSKQIQYRYALTGTPFGRDPIDLWAQFYLTDRGETLGWSLNMYRAAYFNEKKNYWGGKEYTFKKKMQPKLHKVLQNSSIRYVTTECIDLPKQVYTVVRLNWSKELEGYYNRALEEARNAKGNYQEMKNGYIKMRQLCSGFMGLKDEDGDKVELDFPHKPKLDALLELLEEIPGKVVVFNEYTHSGNVICETLKAKKIKHIRMYGGTKDKAGIVKAFRTQKDCKVLVAQNATASTSLNLQVANYAIFYESPTSAITRFQAEKRIHRTGQRNKCFYYDLVIKGSVEEKLLEYFKEAKQMWEATLEGKEAKEINLREMFDDLFLD